MTSKKKILFCDNSLRSFLNFRRDIIESYISDGFETIVVAPYDADESCLPTGARYVKADFSRASTNPFADLSYMFRLFKIYRNEKPDYIFHYTIKPNIYGTVAAKMCGIRSAMMIAGLGYMFKDGGLTAVLARNLYRFAGKFSEKVLVLNQYNYDMVIEGGIASKDKVILLPGGEGINLERFK